MTTTTTPPGCVICLRACEPWPHIEGQPPAGYGHNADPWPGTEDDRACNWCNDNIVIPVRIRRMMPGSES